MPVSLRSCLAVAVLLVCSMVARAADAPAGNSKLASKDMKFINEAAAGGQMEVALGKLAADKATSDDVKKFGQQMVDDHTKANDELMALAKSKGVDLSKANDRASKKTDKSREKLSKMSGADFDKAYMDDMVMDHEKDVKEFEDASKNAEDSDLKAFASKTLPTLQEHLKMAKDIKSKLK